MQNKSLFTVLVFLYNDFFFEKFWERVFNFMKVSIPRCWVPLLFVKKVVSSANNVKNSSSKYQAISLIQMRKNTEPKIETRGTFDLKKADIGLFNSLCLTADICFPFLYRSILYTQCCNYFNQICFINTVKSFW